MAAQNSLGVLPTPLSVIADEVIGPAKAAPPATIDPRRVDAFHHNVSLLARALLELRTIRESELRALTAIQRYLETIRSDRGVSGESQLLVDEIVRQLDDFCSPASGNHERLCSALRHLEQVRAAVLASSEGAT